MKKKADYSKIASCYDKGRNLSEQNINLWLDIVARRSGAREGSRLLDLGCGTGRFTIPMAKNLGYCVTGADYSQEMLDKAREKDSEKVVKWDVQDAQELSYPDESFDLVFMSFLLHHCEDQLRVLRECQRVLTHDGVIIIRHASIEQIRDDVAHIFFPETLAIDEARIFSVEKIEKDLKEAGFTNITSEEIIQKTFTSGNAHLNVILLKNTSVLTMIPQEAYERGVSRLKKYIKEKPNDPWLLYDKMIFTVGHKTI
jgi:ubiquinone/menaquinone biosynthesis C-methylase UbiE